MNTFSFIPEAKTAAQAAFQVRVIERANTLFADGYAVVYGRNEFPQDANMAGIASVVSPDFKPYSVDFFNDTCNCPCCEEHGFCKHLIAVKLKEEADEAEAENAQVAYYEEIIANGYPGNW